MSKTESLGSQGEAQADSTDSGLKQRDKNRSTWAASSQTFAQSQFAAQPSASLLQRMADVLASAKALDEVVPAFLDIVADTFDAAAAGYFEVSPDDNVRLLYWKAGKEVLTARELLASDDLGQHATPKRLAQGFTVPPDYLGAPVSRNTRGVFIDHLSGTSEPLFDEWLTSLNWAMELNVPLVVDDRSIGVVTFHRANDRPYTPDDLALAELLVKQLALAVQLVNLSQKIASSEVEAAVEREQTRAAQERAERLAASNRVLQQTIEAIAAIKSLDELVPRILRTACNAFGAVGASFFEIRDDLQVRLLYWDEQGTTMNPQQLLRSDEPGRLTIRMLAEGFYSPPEYVDANSLGVTILNHRAGTGQAHFDEFCLRHGYELEMNVGVGPGRRTSTLCVYRGTTEPFTEADIELAQALASQLGLALETQKLATRAEEAAVAKEREQAARTRAAELARQNEELNRANVALQRGIQGLSRLDQFDALLGEFLQAAAEVAGAHSGAVVLLDQKNQTYSFAAILSRQGLLAPEHRFAQAVPLSDGVRRFSEEIFRNPDDWFALQPDSPLHEPETLAFHRSQGNRALCHIPMRTGDRFIGWLGLGFPNVNPRVAERRVLLRTLSDQITLAVEILRLSEEAKQLALSREHEQAALGQAAELSKANAALRSSLAQLSGAPDLGNFLATIMRESMRQLGAQDGALLLYDSAAATLTMLQVVTSDSNLPQILRAESTFPADITDAWGRMVRKREPIIFDPVAEAESFWPGTAEWHLSRGNRAVICVPMFLAEEPFGFIGFGVQRSKESISLLGTELVEALAQQATLALYMHRMAERVKASAIAMEREAAAVQRAQDSERFIEALQKSVDALATVGTGPAFIPAVLRIVAKALSATMAAYYDHLPSGEIFLRYFLYRNDIFGPADIREDQDSFMALAARFTRGFTLPDDYLGGPARNVTNVTVIDHVKGTTIPAFDEIAIANGNDRELRIPLVIEGEAIGALIVYRREMYGTEEINLAATLSKQLALGFQLNRSASASLETSIAREREQAAEQRAKELIETHDQLRNSLIAISSGIAYEDRLRNVLRTACVQLRSAGACIFIYEPQKDQLRIAATADNTVAHPGDETKVPARCMAPFPANDLPLWKEFQEKPEPVVLDVRRPEHAKRIRPEAVRWHIENRRHVILGLPLVIDRRILGYLSVTFEDLNATTEVSENALLIGKSLASLIALMVETHQLSRRVQDAAVAEEKNRLAQELHDTLAGAFTGIFMQLQAANELSSGDQARRQSLLRNAEDLARTGLRQVREFVHTLAFSDADPARVVQEMREVVRATSDNVRMQSHFTILGRERRLKPAAANAFLRVLREALGNVQRYAAAQSVFATMQFTDHGATLIVQDDGVGFDVEKVAETGFGIPGMRARMHRLGGSLKIESEPGKGTTVTAGLPDCFEKEAP